MVSTFWIVAAVGPKLVWSRMRAASVAVTPTVCPPPPPVPDDDVLVPEEQPATHASRNIEQMQADNREIGRNRKTMIANLNASVEQLHSTLLAAGLSVLGKPFLNI
jgi:hypothetical protein